MHRSRQTLTSPRQLALIMAFALAFASCRFSIADGGYDHGGENPGAGSIIVPGSGLAGKLGWLRANARNGGGYTIELSEDESVYQILLYFINRINITITIKGVGGNRTITLLSRGNLFYVFGGVTLVIESDITLEGYSDNIYPLIYIAPGGVFIMNKGSSITGNISSVTGGVYLDGGTFTMNGGSIFDNSGGSIYGSGVTVAGGTFIMNGGAISGNTGDISGGASFGGTVTLTGGNFIMNSGTISGNTAKSGGGVMVNRGTFIMSGGTISGNTAAINGGAVIVGVDGAFNISGGTICGNTAGEYGGGVYVGVNGNFYMNGGIISTNTAAYYGWGVYVSGTFTKAGGTISGYTENAGYAGDTGNFKMAESINLGYAVYAYSNSGVRKRKETTAGPEVNLSYSGRNGEYSGEWDY